MSIGSAVVHISVDDSETDAVEAGLDAPPLLYKVSDRPPIYLIILFGFQVSISSLWKLSPYILLYSYPFNVYLTMCYCKLGNCVCFLMTLDFLFKLALKIGVPLDC